MNSCIWIKTSAKNNFNTHLPWLEISKQLLGDPKLAIVEDPALLQPDIYITEERKKILENEHNNAMKNFNFSDDFT